jgi:hypothetical protein
MEDRLTDGRRIAELLAAEIEGHGDELAALAVIDADPEVEPTPDGALAYRVARVGDAGDDEEREDDERTAVAAVYVHPDRVRIEFATGQADAAEAAEGAGLRVRPKAVRPPRTLVFVEDGAAVKRTLAAFAAAAQSD